MDTTGTLVFGVVVCIACAVLKEIKSSYAIFAALAGAIIIIIAALAHFEKINSFISLLQEQSRLPTEYEKILFKILGVCVLGDLSISLCRDQHHGALGDALEIFCKFSVMMLALPIFEDVLSMIGDLLG